MDSTKCSSAVESSRSRHWRGQDTTSLPFSAMTLKEGLLSRSWHERVDETSDRCGKMLLYELYQIRSDLVSLKLNPKRNNAKQFGYKFPFIHLFVTHYMTTKTILATINATFTIICRDATHPRQEGFDIQHVLPKRIPRFATARHELEDEVMHSSQTLCRGSTFLSYVVIDSRKISQKPLYFFEIFAESLLVG